MKVDLFSPETSMIRDATGWHRMMKNGGRSFGYSDSEGNAMLRLEQGAEGIDLFLDANLLPITGIALFWRSEIRGIGLRVFGDALERGYGDLGWQGIRPERMLYWYVLLDECGVQSGIGVQVQPSAFISFSVDTCGLTMYCDLSAGCVGVRLRNREIKIATLNSMLNHNEDAYSFARRFLKSLCPSPKLPRNRVYGFDNWYAYYGKFSAETVLKDCRMMADLSAGLRNRPTYIIDDGWQLVSPGSSANGGPWVGNSKFDNMAELMQRIDKMGIRPGLWFRPLLTSEYVPEDRVWRLEKSGRVLDPSCEGTIDTIQEQIAKFIDWGVGLIKHDFTSYDCLGVWGYEVAGWQVNRTRVPMHDDSHTMAELMRRLYQAISQACGSTMNIACNTSGHLTSGFSEISRIGDDTAWGCNGDWERTRYVGINALSMRLAQNGIFHQCDADCAVFSSHIAMGHSSQWLTLLARSGSCAFLAFKPEECDDRRCGIIRDAFRISSEEQPIAVPMDWQYNSTPVQWKFGNEASAFNWHEPIQEYPPGMWWR